MNTNSMIEYAQSKTRAKTATFQDRILYAFAKAERASDGDKDYANYLATRAILKLVSPITNKNRLANNANNDPYFRIRRALTGLSQISPLAALSGWYWRYVPQDWQKQLDKQDIADIKAMATAVLEALNRHYLYIFVRQDISPEQQAVQAAHATFVAGSAIGKNVLENSKLPTKFDPNQTHFVLIGVPDLNALIHALGVCSVAGIQTHNFYESDMNEQMTAFTTGIVTQENRGVFKQYDTLKFY